MLVCVEFRIIHLFHSWIKYNTVLRWWYSGEHSDLYIISTNHFHSEALNIPQINILKLNSHSASTSTYYSFGIFHLSPYHHSLVQIRNLGINLTLCGR